MFWLLISSGCLFEIVGDIFFKKGLFIWGAIAYLLGTCLWAYSLQFETLSKAIIVFAVANALIGVICGILFFGESLTFLQWLGIFFGWLCLIFL